MNKSQRSLVPTILIITRLDFYLDSSLLSSNLDQIENVLITSVLNCDIHKMLSDSLMNY